MLSMFIGIESANWSLADFQKLIGFCKSNGIRSVILKVYEITQGEWYSNLGGASKVVSLLIDAGLLVMPYGFFYGSDPGTEIAYIKEALSKFGEFCLDMESDFDGNNAIDPYVSSLQGHQGSLNISTWANVQSHNWISNIQKLDPLVTIWMPQAYDDTLYSEMNAQWPSYTLHKIEPTFQVQNSSPQNSKQWTDFSIWEYQMAFTNPGLFQQFLSVAGGSTLPTYPTNTRGMICNPLEIDQFQPGKSEFECGSFAVSILLRATPWNVQNNNSKSNGIAWAESEYALYAGSNGVNNSAGLSVPGMHSIIKDSQKDASGGLHYWDTSISTTSVQSHDIATIKAAIQHGYPVIATFTEASVEDVGLGRNPYWWGPQGNHIAVYVGISPGGNLLVADEANVVEGDGNLQTPKTLQPWPREYDIRSIDNLWATIIKMPWMPMMPSGDPLTWPPYVPPGPPVPAVQDVQVTLDPTHNTLIFTADGHMVYSIVIPLN